MNNICLVRQTNDLKLLQDTDMSNDGIYYNINHTDKTLTVMIVGPKNTPYEGGFYFFDIILGEKYPFKPPKVHFLTNDGRSRMNPNLYTNGKVCLSILGTWSGPSWTSCMTITTVLLALVTVLNENPIQNEPGYENDTGYRCKDYNKFILHENMRIAVMLNYKKEDTYILPFKDIMKQMIIDNKEQYLSYITKLSSYGSSLLVNIYSCNHINEWEKLNEFINSITGDNHQVVTEVDKNNGDSKKKNSRKPPGKKAKECEVGFIMTSEFDGKDYIVILTKDGRRRWSRHYESIVKESIFN